MLKIGEVRKMGLFDIEPIIDTTKGDKIKEEKEVREDARKVGKELDVDNLLE